MHCRIYWAVTTRVGLYSWANILKLETHEYKYFTGRSRKEELQQSINP